MLEGFDLKEMRTRKVRVHANRGMESRLQPAGETKCDQSGELARIRRVGWFRRLKPGLHTSCAEFWTGPGGFEKLAARETINSHFGYGGSADS